MYLFCFVQLVNGVMKAAQSLQTCRNSSLTPQQFEARFNFASALPFLVNLTSHPSTPLYEPLHLSVFTFERCALTAFCVVTQ
jgi:hypothetical protein